jgi:hypothetical protein
MGDVSITGTLALQHTNGGLSAGAQANDNNLTAPGQAVTVLLDVGSKDGVPMKIDTTGSVQVLDALTQSTLGKHFRVFIAPTIDKSFNNYCFQLIGQGVSFCTACNCAITHHHASVKTNAYRSLMPHYPTRAQLFYQAKLV